MLEFGEQKRLQHDPSPPPNNLRLNYIEKSTQCCNYNRPHPGLSFLVLSLFLFCLLFYAGFGNVLKRIRRKMDSTGSNHLNPFADPVTMSEADHQAVLEALLPIGSDASVTIDSHGIIVNDDEFDDSNRTLLCGLITRSEVAKTIPHFHILDAEIVNNTLTVKYVKPKSSKKNAPVSVRTLIYPVAAPADRAQRWVKRLMELAYGAALKRKRIKVLINPFGGAGKAASIFNTKVAPILEAAGCQVDVEQTKHRGHAIELAAAIDIDKYDVLACLSGDGLPMECFNGLARKRNAAEALRKIAVVQIPCGTGNAMSWNLNGTAEPSSATVAMIKGVRTPLDLVSVTQGDKRTLSFLSQSLGIVAETDLGTENIRWMGDLRFTYGFLVRLLGKTVYPIDYAVKTEIDNKDDIRKHYAREVIRRQNSKIASHDILDKELEAQTGLGLPPLKYGTINDPLPKDENSGWTQLQPYHNMGNLYCGNMCWMAADAPFFPASLPNDGMLDLVSIDGDISRKSAAKMLLEVANGSFFDNEAVRVRKISAMRVMPRYGRAMTEITEHDHTTTSTTNPSNPSVVQKILKSVSGSSGTSGFFAVDGEQLPFEPFQIEIHRGLGTVLSRVPGMYEYDGPKGWKDISTDEPHRDVQG